MAVKEKSRDRSVEAAETGLASVPELADLTATAESAELLHTEKDADSVFSWKKHTSEVSHLHSADSELIVSHSPRSRLSLRLILNTALRGAQAKDSVVVIPPGTPLVPLQAVVAKVRDSVARMARICTPFQFLARSGPGTFHTQVSGNYEGDESGQGD
jgi:hypothetical protein